MTNAEKKALYHYIKRLTLSDIEAVTKDEKSAKMVLSVFAEMNIFLTADMIRNGERSE